MVAQPVPAHPLAEVHVPISPTPGFFTRVRLLTATLRRFGGALAGSPVVVTVSRDCEPYDLAAALPWSAGLGIEWRWVDAATWAARGIYGTALHRLTADFAAPFVLMLDADTIVTGPLDELLELGEHDAIGGVIAHIAPEVAFRDGFHRSGPSFWDELHLSAGLIPPVLACEHTGWGRLDHDPDRRYCPAYFNLGVLAASAETMRRLGGVVFEEMDAVDRFVDSHYRCQLAVTLAIARAGAAWSDLPVRWNFPNDAHFGAAYPEDAADVRVLHYLRDDEIRRETDTGSPEGLAALLERTGLAPANALLQSCVAAVAGELGLPVHA